jgi:hypothetical protein
MTNRSGGGRSTAEAPWAGAAVRCHVRPAGQCVPRRGRRLGTEEAVPGWQRGIDSTATRWQYACNIGHMCDECQATVIDVVGKQVAHVGASGDEPLAGNMARLSAAKAQLATEARGIFMPHGLHTSRRVHIPPPTPERIDSKALRICGNAPIAAYQCCQSVSGADKVDQSGGAHITPLRGRGWSAASGALRAPARPHLDHDRLRPVFEVAAHLHVPASPRLHDNPPQRRRHLQPRHAGLGA